MDNINNCGLYNEKWRPQCHYSPKMNWVNDPNGPVYFKGIYHLYYQYIPNSVINNGDMHWGHAVSPDLIHWKEETPVLYPDKVGKMWSGTAYVDIDNKSRLFDNEDEKCGIILAYSTNTQDIGFAYSNDGYHFKKISEDKPIIPHPIGVTDFRDPHLFYYEDDKKWKVVIAGDKLYIYESSDFITWTLSQTKTCEYRTECPNLIKMKCENTNEYVWALTLAGRMYALGSFDGHDFIPLTDRIQMNDGPDTYGGITFANEKYSRHIMISWVNRWAYAKIGYDIWNGGFSLPIHLKLKQFDSGYRILQTPVDEVTSLRDKKLIDLSNTIANKNENIFDNIQSNCYELLLTVDYNKSSSFDINLCIGDGDKTVIRFDKENMKIYFDRTENDTGIKEVRETYSKYDFDWNSESIIDGKVDIRIFVDVAYMEMFIGNGYYYFASRIQPKPSSQKLSLNSDDKTVVDKAIIYKLKSIWR